MSINLHINVDSALEFKKALRELSASVADNALAHVSTDDLLAEVRQRLIKDNLVVRVVDFDDERKNGDNASPVVELPRRGRGRPRREQATEDKAEPQAEPSKQPETEPPKQLNPESDTAKAMVEPASDPTPPQTSVSVAPSAETPTQPTTVASSAEPAPAGDTVWTKPAETPQTTTPPAAEPTPPTLEDVKGALDAHAKTHGQMKTREVMQKVGGALRLMDIGKDKYGTLIAALTQAIAA
jgi:hypothetical protein